MKFKLCLTSALLLVSALLSAQTISLKLEGVTVAQAIEKINADYGYSFIIDATDVDMNKTINLDIQSELIEPCLSKIFAGQKVTFEVDGKIIYVLAVKENKSSSAKAAPGKVTGVVVDASGLPVIGAGVFIQGTTTGVATDTEGHFEIAAKENDVLEFQNVGYKSTIHRIGRNKNISIVLEEDVSFLDEVVVVGYGTQRRVNLTGAVSSITDEAIATTTTSDLATKLQGKVSGLNIRNNSGTPGSFDNSINIRGFGTPLFIIDGINRTSTDFNRLNAEDIESVSVLKDASAAIYGLNAANGVLIVTTKKGRSNQPRFQFNANVGFSSPTEQVTMADAYTYYDLRNQAEINAGGELYISQEDLANVKSTNWYDETFKKCTVRQEYSLSADGGNDRIQFYMNVNYIKDDGMLKSGDLYYDKLSWRSDVTANLTKDLKADFNIGLYTDKQESPSSGFFNIWRGTVTSLPYKGVYANDNPNYYNGVRDGQSYNPVALSYSDNTGYSRNTSTSVQTTFSLDWTPDFFPGFELKGTAAYDLRFARGKTITKNWLMYDYDSENDEYVASPWQKRSSIGNSYNNTRYITIQAQANYKRTFAEAHNLAASFIYEMRSYDADWNSINKYYDFYSNDQVDYAGDTDATSGGNESQARNMSFIGRINYDFKGRYLIELAARYDGSYRYHPDIRWGFFPVVSAGWRISEENWMKSASSWLSNLKIRGSYGQIGEDTGDPFQYLSSYKMSGGGWYEFTNGTTTYGVSSPALVNEYMTWTKSNLANVGLDMGFFDSRLTFSIDAFLKTKTGILAYKNVSVPNTFGAEFPQENLNSNQTLGAEFQISYQNKIGDFVYSISGNVTYSRTKNLYVEESEYSSSWDQYKNSSANRWSDIAWVYKCVGQFQSQEEIDNYAVYSESLGMKYVLPGDWKYEDTNGDGVIDDDDKRPISMSTSALPLWNYGLTLRGSWKGLDVSILLQGAANFKTYHSLTYTDPFWENGNIPEYFTDSWHHADKYDASTEWVSGMWPSVRLSSYAPYLNSYASTMSYMDCSYLRIKNIEIGYTLRENWLRKARIDHVRFFLSGQNLATFCNKYVKAYDPETLAGSSNTGWIYPLMRTFNVGLNLNF